MKTIAHQAAHFVKQYRLTTRTLQSFKVLSLIAEYENFRVRAVDEDDVIIKNLHLTELTRAYQAFTFNRNGTRCIFINRSLPDQLKAELLLHELAHIRLGHMDKHQYSCDSDEDEANAFVERVKSQVYGGRKRLRHILSISAAVAMLGIGIYGTVSLQKDSAAPVNGTAVIQHTDTVTVYITRAGHKYHIADCYHIRKSKLIAVTVEEAETAGYTPCKDCIDK